MNFLGKVVIIFLLIFMILSFTTVYTDAASAPANSINSQQARLKSVSFNKEIGFVIGVILTLLILFIWEPLPAGTMSLLVPVVLVLFDFWTHVSTEEALSGFSNTATITVMALFVLSRGIQNSGIMQVIGNHIFKITGSNEQKQVIIISSLTGSIAGFINNTPTVAAFVPMINDLARRTKVSPSKLLIPLSFASMMGGTLTLVGTSTNILASQLSAQFLDHPFAMFEFTKLGIIVLIVGILYLITIGYRLTPARIKCEDEEYDYMAEYEMRTFLTEVVVEEDCLLIKKNIRDIFDKIETDIDIVQIRRGEEQYMEPLDIKTIRAGDHLVVRAEREALLEFIRSKGLKLLPEIEVSQSQLENPAEGEEVIEAVISDDSFLKGRTINEVNFLDRYDASLLAIRHGENITHKGLKDFVLRAGDVLLLLVTRSTLARLKDNENFIIEVSNAPAEALYEPFKVLTSLGVLFSIILLATLEIVPIAIGALGGVLIMVTLDLVETREVYESINWDIFFLLAGLIPLGVAIEETNTAGFIAAQILNFAGDFPPVVVLGLFYYFTAILTCLISNNASVIIMIPVAVNAAQKLGANPFAFLLAVTFAASAAFATPVGYQTNLMVYGPGGYKFSDFTRVGAPLQIIMTLIVPWAISLFWGL